MLDWINSVMQSYYAATKESPLLATAALPVLGGLMYAVRNLPQQLWEAVKRQLLVRLTLNNAGWDGNQDAFHAFDRWFMQSGYKRWSRRFFLFRHYERESGPKDQFFRIGIGNGTHFFIHEGKLFWFTKGNLDSSGSERQKEEITVSTFGRNSRAFDSLVDMFNQPRERGGAITVHNWSTKDSSWEERQDVLPRKLSTVCISEKNRTDILKRIDEFTENKAKYRRKGLTYKLSMIFTGPPGTGKSTLCKSVAGHYAKDLYLLDLASMTNKSLLNALTTVKPGSIVLIEDVDGAGNAVKDRTDEKQDLVTMLDIQELTLQGVLNAIDGVISLDNVLIFMTTNHPEKLDAAFQRKGRIDYHYVIDNMTKTEIQDYMKIMYDDHPSIQNMLSALNHVGRSDLWLPGCEVENAYKENMEDPLGFVDELLVRHQTINQPQRIAA